MKKIIGAVLSFLTVALIVIMGIFYLSDLTERKDSKNKFSEFYEQDANFEVLFLGQSHVLNGVFPMELWNDYGIVSYNMAGHGNRMAMNYWVLKNALEYTTPKLVVLDCCMIGMEDKISSVEQLHISADHIPYSQTKADMIEDLVEEEDRRGDFLWKFSTYHNRWNEVTEQDFVPKISPEKGAESRIDVAVPEAVASFEASEKIEGDTLGTEYACRIIEECQEKGIDVLLTYLPFPDRTGWQLESNFVWELAEEYSLEYLDFHTLLKQVNLNTDFYDKDSHMNPSGARKITSYLGEYIMAHYPVEDQRDNEDYSFWHDDYEIYVEFKKENIQKEEELKNYLMLLKDKSFSYGIYFKPWNIIGSYPVLVELLSNMGIDYTQIPNEDHFLLVDNDTGERKVMRLNEKMKSKFADFSMFYNENGHLELTNSAAESMIITYSDLAVIVFDNTDLSFVDQAKFVLKDMPYEFRENME